MSKEFDRRVKEFFRTCHERGMKKWSGFFLSDHRVAIKNDNLNRAESYLKKPDMSPGDISRILLKHTANIVKSHYSSKHLIPTEDINLMLLVLSKVGLIKK